MKQQIIKQGNEHLGNERRLTTNVQGHNSNKLCFQLARICTFSKRKRRGSPITFIQSLSSAFLHTIGHLGYNCN